jgi:hypothetical protein
MVARKCVLGIAEDSHFPKAVGNLSLDQFAVQLAAAQIILSVPYELHGLCVERSCIWAVPNSQQTTSDTLHTAQLSVPNSQPNTEHTAVCSYLASLSDLVLGKY